MYALTLQTVEVLGMMHGFPVDVVLVAEVCTLWPHVPAAAAVLVWEGSALGVGAISACRAAQPHMPLRAQHAHLLAAGLGLQSRKC
jgi:hypothetical protein